jgi:hypothetical protein
MNALDLTKFAAAKLNLLLGVGLDAELPKLALRVATCSPASTCAPTMGARRGRPSSASAVTLACPRKGQCVNRSIRCWSVAILSPNERPAGRPVIALPSAILMAALRLPGSPRA